MSLEKNPTTGMSSNFCTNCRISDISQGGTKETLRALKGTIPPGVSVPLHSHADTEDFSCYLW